MADYWFVHTSEPDSAITLANKPAKGHAIRSGIRRGWSTAGAANNQSQAIIKQKKELHGRFRLVKKNKTSSPESTCHSPRGKVANTHPSLGRRSRTIRSGITISIGNGLDPFQSFPIPQNKQADELFYYFLTKFKLNESNARTKSTWFPYALQSAPVMHSTLALSAALLAATSPEVAYYDTALRKEGLYQKGEAMRLIREWCSQSNTSYPDSHRVPMMISISTMSTVEVLYGNFEAAKTHLLGVHKLYELLEGGKEFVNEPILCKSVNFADLFLASALGNLPKLPLFQSYEISLPEEVQMEAMKPQLHPFVSTCCSRSVAQAFSYLRLAITATRFASTTPETIRMLINVADDKLLEALHGETQDAPSAKSPGIVHVVAQAAHLFLYVVIRQIPAKSILVREMSGRLSSSIEEIIKRTGRFVKHPDVIAWAACVGVLSTWTEGSEKDPMRTYFLGVLYGLGLGLEHPSDLLWASDCHLSSFLWDDKRCSHKLRRMVEEWVPGD